MLNAIHFLEHVVEFEGVFEVIFLAFSSFVKFILALPKMFPSPSQIFISDSHTFLLVSWWLI